MPLSGGRDSISSRVCRDRVLGRRYCTVAHCSTIWTPSVPTVVAGTVSDCANQMPLLVARLALTTTSVPGGTPPVIAWAPAPRTRLPAVHRASQLQKAALLHVVVTVCCSQPLTPGVPAVPCGPATPAGPCGPVGPAGPAAPAGP